MGAEPLTLNLSYLSPGQCAPTFREPCLQGVTVRKTPQAPETTQAPTFAASTHQRFTPPASAGGAGQGCRALSCFPRGSGAVTLPLSQV